MPPTDAVARPADLLYGSAKSGKYQFDKVLNVSSKTADGVVSLPQTGRGGRMISRCSAVPRGNRRGRAPGGACVRRAAPDRLGLAITRAAAGGWRQERVASRNLLKRGTARAA